MRDRLILDAEAGGEDHGAGQGGAQGLEAFQRVLACRLRIEPRDKGASRFHGPTFRISEGDATIAKETQFSIGNNY
jgi:hypothetical protein